MGILGQNGASGHTPQGSTVGAVWGDSQNGNGVYGSSSNWNGVEGDSWSPAHAGVAGQNNAGGPAVWGSSSGNAGQFEGNVLVTGKLTVEGDVYLPGADCAEQFDADPQERIDPGTVVVIDKEGTLCVSRQAYDCKVAGVVSGAGRYRPGIILDQQPLGRARVNVALLGKVCCKVDASFSPIGVGDLLTTSPTPGHAMKADDPLRSHGSIIGKALLSLREGRGIIPILAALQ